MIEFIDKTSTVDGTNIDREHMMAIQGFIGCTTTFNSDGSITEENDLDQTKTTTFNSDGSITETFVGTKTITKTTTFLSNGNIEEDITV